MPDIFTATGTKFAIGPAATSATDTAGEYAALTPWVEVDMVRSIGAFGDAEEILRYEVISSNRRLKSKGISDAGDPELVLAHAPDDLGQAALLAASQTKNAYAVRVTLPNRLNPTGTDEIRYFRAIIGKPRLSALTNDAFIEDTYTIGITSPIVIVAPTAGV